MAFSLSDLPAEIGRVKELSPDEAVEVLVARAVQGKVAAGNAPGFDVHKSALFPGETFQVKFSRALFREGSTKVLGGYLRTFKDTWKWAFNVSKSKYQADWYVLFGERDGLIYPFLFDYSEWVEGASNTGKGRLMTITAQQHSRCGRYAGTYKLNRRWENYIANWPGGFLRALKAYEERPEQLVMPI